ncbi:MAG: acetylxylan esterase [Phycisphaeraceae bacterium]
MRLQPLLVLLIVTTSALAQDLTVLPADKDAPPKQMLRRYLTRLADDAFARRLDTYNKVKTPDDLKAYQANLRQVFLDALGPMPQRGPLNAQTVGTIKDEGYRIEKVIFESQPGHLVTANLYVPAGDGPHPAVVVPCGHSQSGKAAQQSICLALVKAGFIALTYDPISQGERIQLLDADGKKIVGMTTEHTMLGASSIPVGRGTATYRIFDGSRAIDYLESRAEVDAKKIGVTGVSGGGTMSSYLMALDDRVACAAPSCFITSIPKLLATIGPQDAEQNIFGQIANSLDHADYMILRAPRPTLVLAGTQDFFNIEGTWDSFRQAQRAYTRLGAAERIAIVETDTKHGYPREQREAMVRWMRRWMMNKDEPWSEPELKTRPESELLCTEKGQVMLLDGAVSVMDLNAALAKRFERQRAEGWKPANVEATLKEVRRISGVREFKDLPEPKVTVVGKIDRKTYTIEKVIIEPEPGIQLPALLLKPKGASRGRLLSVRGEGKHTSIDEGSEIERYVQSGLIVLDIDLRGMGETGPAKAGMWGGDWHDIFLSYLLGRSLVAMRAEDVLVGARVLAAVEGEGKGKPVDLAAYGMATPAALHAAALERKLFGEVEIVNPSPASWMDAVKEPQRGGHLAHVIHGALTVYDLTDLADVVKRENK